MAHSVPATVFWICGLLLAVVAIEHYTRRTAIPPVCWVLVAGMTYGLLRTHAALPLPALHVGPHVVLFVFLPLLIFDSSRRLHVRELGSVLPEAGFLALVGPLAGMFLLGWPLSLVGGLPLPDALLFGAVLSATDPVAVSAIFQSFPVPERLHTIIEGESLLNDGITVLLFTTLAGTVIGETVLSVPSTVAHFAASVSGAVALGIAFGGLGSLIMKSWHDLHDRFIGSLMPLITVYAAFAVAEHILHISGVLAVMAAALTLASLHIHRKHSSAPRQADRFFDDFWGFLSHLANAVLFFILGERMGEHAYRLSWYLIPLMIGALIASRAVIVYCGAGLFRILHARFPASWRHVLTMGGLRGALSIALLLTLPDDYRYRHLFLCLAFALVLFTVIVNTLALRGYLSKVSVEDPTESSA